MINILKEYINSNNALKDLALNSFWSIVGTLISKVLLFLIWVFVAKLLQATLYGEFSIIKSTTVLFADFVGISIGAAGANFVAKHYQSNTTKLNKIIGVLNTFAYTFGFILFLISILSSHYIAENLLEKPELASYLQTCSIVIFLSSVNNNQLGILRGLNLYKKISAINLLQIIFAFPVYIIATYFFSLKGAVFAYVFYYVVICIFSGIEVNKVLNRYNIIPSYRNFKYESKIVSSFILPYVISGVVVALLSWYNETRLVIMEGGYKMMGYYSILNVIFLMIIGVSTMVCTPFVSIMSKYRYSPDSSLLERLNMNIPLQVTMIVVIPLILIPEIVQLIYGRSYSIEYIRQISSFIFFNAFLAVYRNNIARYIAVKEKTWLYLFDSISFAILTVLLFRLLYKFGIQGFVISQTIAYVVVVLLFFPLYIKMKIIPYSLLKDFSFQSSFLIILVIFSISFINIHILIRISLCLIIILLAGYIIFKGYLRK